MVDRRGLKPWKAETAEKGKEPLCLLGSGYILLRSLPTPTLGEVGLAEYQLINSQDSLGFRNSWSNWLCQS